MSTPSSPKPESQLTAYFERFREITKTTNRSALLWLVALVIVWYSGLERTRREADENLGSLQINNSEKQKFENQIWHDHLKFVDANLDAQLFKEHQEENRKLPEFKRLLQQARQNGEKEEIFRYQKIVQDIESRLTPLNKLKGAARKEAEEAQEVEEQREAAVKTAEELKQNRQATAKEYQENQLSILHRYQELRQQRKGVTFEILNQSFEVPPLYAALIWSVFLIGLILYVARSRFILLSLSAEVLSHSQDGVITERYLKAEAPWWLAPLPRLQFQNTSDTHDKDSPAKTDSSQLYRLLDWEHGNRTATLLVMASLLGLALVQMRVVWLELEISRLIGTLQDRAIVPVIATAVLFLTFLSIWIWLRFRRLPVSQHPTPHKIRPAHVFASLVILGIFVFLFVYMYRHIGAGIAYERGLKASLFYLSILLIFEVTAFCLYEWFRPLPSGLTGEPAPSRKLVNRRWFLYAAGIFAIVGGIGIGRTFANAGKKQRRVRVRRSEGHRASYKKRSIKRRLRRKQGRHKMVSLPAGFYRNPETEIVHFVSKNGHLLSSANSGIKVERLQEFTPEAIDVFDETPGLEISSEVVRTASGNSRDNIPTLFSHYPFAEGGQSRLVKDLNHTPRINLSTASHAFDETVRSILSSSKLTHKDYEKACECLAFAINHDILIKGRSGQFPSLRLYDLLAGLSVRYNRIDYLEKMVDLIESSNNADVFQSRMNRWQDSGSSWYRRWSKRRQPMTWSNVKFK